MIRDDAKGTLQEFRSLFEPRINNFFAEQRSLRVADSDAHTLTSFDYIADIATRDAKRLRASFVYHAYRSAGGTDDALALNLGIVIELLHAYLLIIDDISDTSSSRRGKPAVHKMFEEYYNRLDKRDTGLIAPDYYGISMGMTAGIYACHLAFEYFHSLPIPSDVQASLAHLLHTNLRITGSGQLLDITNSLLETVSEEDIVMMLNNKTGVYTYLNPLHAGVRLAGNSDPLLLSALESYALSGGKAFQIFDDYLGIFGNDEETGKSNRDDLREGKYTLLVHHIMTQGTEEAVQSLRSVLGKNVITDEEHEMVKRLLVEEGTIEYVTSYARELTDKAVNALETLPSTYQGPSTGYLKGIADYMINRTK